MAGAIPPQVTVTAPAQFEIMRAGKVSGRIALTAGTHLDVEQVDGEFVLVQYRGVKGRVLAKSTDLATRDAVPVASAPATVESANVPTPPPIEPLGEKVAVSTTKADAPPVGVKTAAAKSGSARPAVTPLPSAAPAEDEPDWPTIILLLATFIVTMGGYWRLFTKAGKPGWAVLVPIYNVIIWQKISGKPLWWLLLYAVPVVNLVVGVLAVFGIASNFGKGKAFAVGLLLAPYVFVPVLAFGNAQYVGAPC